MAVRLVVTVLTQPPSSDSITDQGAMGGPRTRARTARPSAPLQIALRKVSKGFGWRWRRSFGNFRFELQVSLDPINALSQLKLSQRLQRGGMMAKANPNRTLLDKTFKVSLVLKGLDGVLELVGGILLLLVSPAEMGSVVRYVTQHELSEDPHDLIATALVHLAGTMTTSATLFSAIYLLLHGLVKVVLVWAVLRDKLWAYPWMIAFLLVFIAYQGYELLVAFTWGMVLLTAFDIFIVWLTLHEYRAHRTRTANHRPKRQRVPEP
ncbi:MAG TPA: hypothetical protein DCL83_03005 [Arthrobacter bacterium]|nr:hypothetical protein [Arthrobacter sp.]